MKSIFKDPALAAAFEKDGYVVLDVLDEIAVQQLRDLLHQCALDFGDTFYSSSFIPDKARKHAISTQLEAIIDPKVAPFFSHHRKLGSVFLIKPSGSSGIMPIHQDWTVVDESEFDSITVWMPLQDTTEENGALRILPRSHRISQALRAPTLVNPLRDILAEAESLMQPLPLKAGQAFVFSHALLHASFPNHSGLPRVAVAYGVLHQDAELIYYFRENAGEPLEKLKVPDDFFLNYPAPGERPQDAQKIAQVDYQEFTIKPDDFKTYFGLIQEKPGLWQRLRKLFAS
jgi:hypothetical protein